MTDPFAAMRAEMVVDLHQYRLAQRRKRYRDRERGPRIAVMQDMRAALSLPPFVAASASEMRGEAK